MKQSIMKKILIVGFITLGVLTFMSCADEECICILNDGTEEGFGEDDISTNSLQDACDDQNEVYQASSIGSCSIEES